MLFHSTIFGCNKGLCNGLFFYFQANLELRGPGRHSDAGQVDLDEPASLQTEWQEEEELVKAAGFDLSWLPGGAPDHFVMLQAPLNARLSAGRFIDINVALTSSCDLLEPMDSAAASATWEAQRTSESQCRQQNQANPSLAEGEGSSSRRVAREGQFVAEHGQQTLSNTVWALTTFEVEGLDGVQDAISACCQLFCRMRPQDVHLQARPS